MPGRIARLPTTTVAWRRAATLSYTILPRLTADVGYMRMRDAGQVTNSVGTAVNYVLRS